MSFLHINYLFGCGLVIIPITIHLLNFRSTKKVYFTNVDFLYLSKQEGHRYNTLKGWLILIARSLFIVFLFIAFAQPYIDNSDLQTTNELKINMYLDNSYSLQNTAEDRSLLSYGIEAAEKIATAMPNEVLYSWNTNNLSKAEQSLPLDLLMEKLYSTLHGNKERTIQEIYDFQSSYNTNRSTVFFWISDFQSSTSGDLSNLDIDSTHSYYLVPLKPTFKS